MNIMTKAETLRNDLRSEIFRIDPKADDLLIITPRLTELAFTPQYSQFLAEVVSQGVPGVNFVILSEPLSINRAGKPAEGEESSYYRGWNDCLSSLITTKELASPTEKV
jgi:hypothetical protein